MSRESYRQLAPGPLIALADADEISARFAREVLCHISWTSQPLLGVCESNSLRAPANVSEVASGFQISGSVSFNSSYSTLREPSLNSLVHAMMRKFSVVMTVAPMRERGFS